MLNVPQHNVRVLVIIIDQSSYVVVIRNVVMIVSFPHNRTNECVLFEQAFHLKLVYTLTSLYFALMHSGSASYMQHRNVPGWLHSNIYNSQLIHSRHHPRGYTLINPCEQLVVRRMQWSLARPSRSCCLVTDRTEQVTRSGGTKHVTESAPPPPPAPRVTTTPHPTPPPRTIFHPPMMGLEARQVQMRIHFLMSNCLTNMTKSLRAPVGKD